VRTAPTTLNWEPIDGVLAALRVLGVIPIDWAKFAKTSEIENPLLQVPPASRGNLKSAISSRREHTPQAL
jgi:hypothetical protein